MNVDQWTLRPWSILSNGEAGRALVAQIRSELERAIEPPATERDVLKLLRDTAYCYFNLNFDCGFIAHEFQLHNRYRADFVIAEDYMSRGNEYRFIELESPTEKPYTANGNPSGLLNHALQQIRDWKRWLRGNMQEASRLFPSLLWDEHVGPVITFEIIIGRAKDFERFTARIAQLERDNDIVINSYDHLLHNLDRKTYFRNFSDQAGQITDFSKKVRNVIVSPFRTTFSSTEYEEIIRTGRRGIHLTIEYAQQLAEHAVFNSHLAEFDRIAAQTIEAFERELRDNRLSEAQVHGLMQNRFFRDPTDAVY
jgi:Domain of unknown function (DUF4263)